MSRRLWIGWVFTCVLFVAGCGQPTEPDVADNQPRAMPVKDVPVLPEGWRWESYGGVEVGVPADWGWGIGGQRINQWCAETPHARRDPIVGRPGPQTLVGCPRPERGPDPETLLENTGTVVAFSNPFPPGEEPDGGPVRSEEGDRLRITLNGVVVDIHAEQALAARIAATVHAVDVDSYGCATTHPVSQNPGRRPPDPVDVTGITVVTAVSACKYAIARGGTNAPAALISSLRLEGQAAQDAIDAVAAAPDGGGPDDPSSCMVDVSYGDELIVLRLTSEHGEPEVYFRYAGCDHNGFDDGTTVRAMTSAAVRPFVAGPNQVSVASGPRSKVRMLRPDLR